jgi:hypothetical protein
LDKRTRTAEYCTRGLKNIGQEDKDCGILDKRTEEYWTKGKKLRTIGQEDCRDWTEDERENCGSLLF